MKKIEILAVILAALGLVALVILLILRSREPKTIKKVTNGRTKEKAKPVTGSGDDDEPGDDEPGAETEN